MLDKERGNALRSIRASFHKYTECVYVHGMDSLTREELEDTYQANKNMKVPTYEEMQEQIFRKLIENKFRFVRVEPHKANCAIRIYRKEMEVDGKPGGVCGAVCFARNLLGKWTTIDSEGKVKMMDFNETYKVEYWTSVITQYSEPVKADYYDVYLKVTCF